MINYFILTPVHIVILALIATLFITIKKQYYKIFSDINSENIIKFALFEVKYWGNIIFVRKTLMFFPKYARLFRTFLGDLRVSFISYGKVIDILKKNQFERCNSQVIHDQGDLLKRIKNRIQTILSIEGVTVTNNAKHLCYSSRRIRDDMTATVIS
ncbi:GTP cyclohydrolase I [Bizionia paragorgiae]|uniref:GTP cyclohydrolase I n=2 Tax=Bizionia paragorgiae TaxID=283786 RepID=A0A1H3XSD2_BIZPA|nr:GTP cyclohydrolase I [Bizionia paragorgiae]SEA02150.1 GTP cyclohydrolase I [Bizionia paragorgiae]